MAERDEAALKRQLDRLERELPDALVRRIRWLRKPSSRGVRVPASALLIVAGVFSFLPVLGIWMLPLGLLLLAQDLPFMQRPMRRALTGTRRYWIRRKRSRRRGRP